MPSGPATDRSTKTLTEPAMHISEIDTPALVVDLDVLEANIYRAQAYFDRHGIRFRPHMKTHKCPQIGRIQVTAGAVGLTCAKLGEAEVMADAGFEDLMVAYPILGESKLARLVRLVDRVRFTSVFDSPEVAEGLSRAAESAGVRIRCLVEVDTGMKRCGVAPGPQLYDLCRRVADSPGLEFAGLMTYQGWIAGTEAEKEAAWRSEDSRVAETVGHLNDLGLACEVVSGGSSPSLYSSHFAPSITENRCGTYIFNDRNMAGAEAASWDDCALRIAVTVVSDAVPDQIVVDGGSKTFTSDSTAAWPGFGRFVEDPSLLLHKMNEEHGYVRLGSESPRHRIGDRLHVIPNHVCVTVNMQDELWVHRGGEVVDCWPVAARGKLR